MAEVFGMQSEPARDARSAASLSIRFDSIKPERHYLAPNALSILARC